MLESWLAPTASKGLDNRRRYIGTTAFARISTSLTVDITIVQIRSVSIMEQALPRFRPMNRLDAQLTQWLARMSVPLLRISLGFVFLAFGVLKFFPDISPAEAIAQRTTAALTLGIVEGDLARLFVATMETVIGLSLLTGRYLRIGIALLGIAMVGVLSPLVLFPDELFSREFNAPTLTGQYVVKDIVLLAAGLVVTLRERGAELVIVPEDDAEANT